MTVLPHYDEFGIYTTFEDVRCYITSLLEKGISSEEEVINSCLAEFGRNNSDLIEKVLYGED